MRAFRVARPHARIERGVQEIHDQVVAILTPGSETVASTIMWLLQVLTEHPEHADRVAAEVESVTGGRPVAFEDVRALRYTNNVVVEAMRLRPAVWILTRRAVTDTELGGYRIPAGADIIYSPYAIQRAPSAKSLLTPSGVLAVAPIEMPVFLASSITCAVIASICG